jgi:hypothetical protein
MELVAAVSDVPVAEGDLAVGDLRLELFHHDSGMDRSAPPEP